MPLRFPSQPLFQFIHVLTVCSVSFLLCIVFSTCLTNIFYEFLLVRDCILSVSLSTDIGQLLLSGCTILVVLFYMIYCVYLHSHSYFNFVVGKTVCPSNSIILPPKIHLCCLNNVILMILFDRSSQKTCFNIIDFTPNTPILSQLHHIRVRPTSS